MKIGIKTFDYDEDLKKLVDIIDFIEIMAVETSDYSKFKDFNIPFVIHAQHQRFEVNNADKTRLERNKRSLNFAIKIADMLNAKKIVIHPGLLTDENCSSENAVSFFNQFNDKRIIIENMPFPENKKQLCTDVDETKKFLNKTKKGFCLDFNHAVIGFLDSKDKYLQRIKDFLKLKPVHYHIGGQKLNGESHLNFKDCDINIQEIIDLIPENAEVTLETTVNMNDLKEDIEFMRKIIRKK